MKVNKGLVESLAKSVISQILNENSKVVRPQGVVNEMDAVDLAVSGFRKYNDTESGDGKLKGVYQRIFDGLIKAEEMIKQEVEDIINKTVTDEALANDYSNFFRTNFEKYFNKYVITPCNNLTMKSYDGTTVKNDPLKDVAYFIQDKFNTFKEELLTNFENMANSYSGKYGPTTRRLANRINTLLQKYDDKLFRLIDNYSFEGNTKRNIGESYRRRLNEDNSASRLHDLLRTDKYLMRELELTKKAFKDRISKGSDKGEVLHSLVNDLSKKVVEQWVRVHKNKRVDQSEKIKLYYFIKRELLGKLEEGVVSRKSKLNESSKKYDFSTMFSKYDEEFNNGKSYIELRDKFGQKAMEVKFFDKEDRPYVNGNLFLELVQGHYGYYLEGTVELTYYYYGDGDEDWYYDEYSSINNFSIGEKNGELYIYGAGKGIDNEIKESILSYAKECLDVILGINESTIKTLNENKKYWLGIPKALHRYNGDWSDSQVEYNGRLYNETILFDSMYENYRDLCDNIGEECTDEGFYEWCKSEDGIYEFENYIYCCDEAVDFEIVNTKLLGDCKSVYVVKDREYNGIWCDGKLYDTDEVVDVIRKEGENGGNRDIFDEYLYAICENLTPISEDLTAKNVGHRGKIRESRKRKLTENTYQGQEINTYYTDGEYYYYAYSYGSDSNSDKIVYCKIDEYGTIIDQIGLLTCNYGYDVDFYSTEVGFNPDEVLEEISKSDLPFSFINIL